jgi:hypothetical protein
MGSDQADRDWQMRLMGGGGAAPLVLGIGSASGGRLLFGLPIIGEGAARSGALVLWECQSTSDRWTSRRA